MTKNHPSLASYTLLSFGILLGACAQTSSDAVETTEMTLQDTQSVQLAPAISTVKPGASVTFSQELTQGLDSGDTGFATITINEGYPAGRLNLTATGDAGVSIAGGQASTQFDMAGRTTHTWRVDFSAESDGVHYLHLVAKADADDGLAQSRAHAIRVEVGDWKAVQIERQAAKSMEAMASGEMAVMMPAEETIE